MLIRLTLSGRISAKEIKQKADAAIKLYGGPIREIKIEGDFECTNGEDINLYRLIPIIHVGKKYVTILEEGEEKRFDPLEGYGNEYLQSVEISLENSAEIAVGY